MTRTKKAIKKRKVKTPAVETPEVSTIPEPEVSKVEESIETEKSVAEPKPEVSISRYYRQHPDRKDTYKNA